MALYSKCKLCGNKIKYRTTYCDECKKEHNKHIIYKDSNDEVRRIYQTSRWRKTREQVKLRDKGLCQLSLLEGKIVPGDAVHHIEVLRPNTIHLAFDLNNLILLSKDKHDMLHRLGIDSKEKFIKYVESTPESLNL